MIGRIEVRWVTITVIVIVSLFSIFDYEVLKYSEYSRVVGTRDRYYIREEPDPFYKLR